MQRKEALYKIKGYLSDYLPQEDADEIDELLEALSMKPLIERFISINEEIKNIRTDNSCFFTIDNIIKTIEDFENEEN